jgi:hypothetical protein
MPASLDDVIKTCENLHVEEQHQLKALLQKYEHQFDGTLGEFNTKLMNIQLMVPDCKPIHAHAYSLPRSVEQQLQQCKIIERLVDIQVSLRKTIPLNGNLLPHHLQFLRKTEQ